MILRDPVHGLISFEGAGERLVTLLLETSEVQRLRRVRQLGLASFAFPGAEHTRFVHAVGTAFLMSRWLMRVEALQHELPSEMRLTDENRFDALAAAMLHDIGHGPFSHLFEDVVPDSPSHESWGQRILLDPSTEVHRALESFSRGMAHRCTQLLAGTYPLAYLSRAVSGTLDVDRCDYLLRDSHMTGVRYGLYDLDWLLRSLRFAEVPTTHEWVLAIDGRKGLPPIEGFFLGRHFMYQQVYHHKVTRASEIIVRALLKRVVELIQTGTESIAVPPAILSAARGEPIALSDYLRMDDVDLLACVESWSRSSDSVLADLAHRLRNRRIPKTLALPNDPSHWKEIEDRAADAVSRQGFRPDLYLFLDVPTDVPFREPEEVTAEGVWVHMRESPMKRLGDVSFLLGELKNKSIIWPRLIFPAETREEVATIVKKLLG